MEIIVLYLPACASRCSCCSAESASLSQHRAQWACLGPAAEASRACTTPGTRNWAVAAILLLLLLLVVRASMFVTSLPNTASLTLSIWTVCSDSAAYRFATDPSFSYSRESKMLAERREISLHVFFLFFHCFQESASFLLSKIQCCNFVIAVFIKWIINLKALSPNLYMHV